MSESNTGYVSQDESLVSNVGISISENDSDSLDETVNEETSRYGLDYSLYPDTAIKSYGSHESNSYGKPSDSPPSRGPSIKMCKLSRHHVSHHVSKEHTTSKHPNSKETDSIKVEQSDIPPYRHRSHHSDGHVQYRPSSVQFPVGGMRQANPRVVVTEAIVTKPGVNVFSVFNKSSDNPNPDASGNTAFSCTEQSVQSVKPFIYSNVPLQFVMTSTGIMCKPEERPIYQTAQNVKTMSSVNKSGYQITSNIASSGVSTNPFTSSNTSPTPSTISSHSNSQDHEDALEHEFINHYTRGQFQYKGFMTDLKEAEEELKTKPKYNKSDESWMDNYLNPHRVSPEKERSVVCAICNDHATGLHYGIITCEG